jgi:glycerophosphoryl diester phosphodiesterase
MNVACNPAVAMNSLCLWTMAAMLTVGTPPEIIAHRGESADAPENTLAAFRLAWERDCDAIELDVHLTADDRLAVIHDADTERTCGEKVIIKTTRFEELENLDAGLWKGEAFRGEPIPVLEDALATVPSGKRCFIEVKVGPEAVPALARAVQSSGLPNEQLVVISFQSETIAEVRRVLPEHEAYWLVGFKQDEASGEFTPPVEEIIATARAIDAHGVNVSYKGPIDAAFVRSIRESGLGLYVWTVDDEAVARRLVELGVDGITTNRAAWLADRLEHNGSPDSP